MKIVKIVVLKSFPRPETDTLELHFDGPNGWTRSCSFYDNAIATMDADDGAAYAAQYFPGVPVEIAGD